MFVPLPISIKHQKVLLLSEVNSKVMKIGDNINTTYLPVKSNEKHSVKLSTSIFNQDVGKFDSFHFRFRFTKLSIFCL